VTALGICVVFQVGRPVVTGVAVSGVRDTPLVEQAFELKTSSTAIADQIDDLVRGLRSKLASMSVNRCVVKIADYSRIPNNKPAPRHRLMIEGALIFACRDQGIAEINVLNGKEVGAALSCSKEEAIAAGARLDDRKKEAAAAAIGALDE
jgi:hypothetical protein